ncbi:MAG: histidinol-phosphate transaminase [Spirochaetales bacterium]|nr:histidinol-phosphate transaminase [Spirochaetales bacterium]
MKLRKNLEQIKPYIAGKLKEGAIKLASNENPSGSSPKAIESIREFLDKVYLYPDSRCAELKTKLARKCGISEEMLILGNGSDEILLFIAGAYIEQGRNAVTSEATFSEYTFATILFGGSMKYAKMTDLRYDLDNLLRIIDENTQVIFIANPNNPTGTYVTQSELTHFMGNIPDYMLVVIDEAYVEYVKESDFPDTLSLFQQYNNLLILRTFSKLYGLAGLRIGYGIGSPQVIGDLHKTKEPFNVNAVAQAAALGALDDHEFVEKTLKINQAGKEYLYREFDAMNLQYWKSAANFILVRTGMDCMKVFNILMDQGVTIRPLPVCGYTDTIRVTIGTMEQNELFIRLLKDLPGK